MAGWGKYSGGTTIQLGQADYSEDNDNNHSTQQPPVSEYASNTQQGHDDSDEEQGHQTPSWAKAAEKEPAPAYGQVAPIPETSSYGAPKQTSSGQYEKKQSDLQQKEYMLQIKEQKLKTKEDELKKREAALGSGVTADGHFVPQNNWPFRGFALVYHNIQEEVPEINQRMVYLAYITWIITFIGYVLNWFIIMIAMFAGEKDLWQFFVATLVAVIGIPASFICWYKWGIYKAAQTSGSFTRYGCFFLNFCIHFAFTVILIIAIPVIATYSVGAISMIDFFKESDGVGNFLGIMSIITMAVWGLNLLLSFWIFGMAANAFRKIDFEAQATEMAVSGATHVARAKLNEQRR